MTEKQKIIYLAGLFDGEGCISIVKPHKHKHYRLMLRISNSNPLPLKMCTELFGGNIYLYKRKKRKPLWEWTLCRKATEKFMVAILPYVIIKKDEIQVALEFLRTVKFRNARVSIPEIRKREKFKKELLETKQQPYLM